MTCIILQNMSSYENILRYEFHKFSEERSEQEPCVTLEGITFSPGPVMHINIGQTTFLLHCPFEEVGCLI